MQSCSSKASAMDVVFKEQIEGERQGCCENPSVLPFVRVEEGPGGAEQDYDQMDSLSLAGFSVKSK